MNVGMRRPGGDWSLARIDKADHYQTVLYEIDMLRFCYSRLVRPPEAALNADIWTYLESFLVHYRNLLYFFGVPPKRTSDLTLVRPEEIWSMDSGLASTLPDRSVLDEMSAKGSGLWQKYEDSSKRDDTISRYLQHCTSFRLSPKRWFPVEMMNEIGDLLAAFEKLLPEFKPASRSQPIDRGHFLGGGSMSTNSGN